MQDPVEGLGVTKEGQDKSCGKRCVCKPGEIIYALARSGKCQQKIYPVRDIHNEKLTGVSVRAGGLQGNRFFPGLDGVLVLLWMRDVSWTVLSSRHSRTTHTKVIMCDPKVEE